MITVILNQVVQGITMVVASYSHIKRHWQLVVYALLTPLLTLCLTPLLFKLIVHLNYLHLPSWLFTLFFSFFGLVIFNFIYFGLVTYHFKLFAHEKPSLREVIVLSTKKFPLIMYWSLVSTLVSTILNVLLQHAHRYPLLKYSIVFFIVTKVVDGFWWAINFLIIPALAVQDQSITQGLMWIIRIINKMPGLIISAASLLFLFKYYTGEFAFLVAQHTPRIMQELHLITVTPVTQRLFIFIYLPATVLIISSIIATFNITAESILSSAIYLHSLGTPIEEMQNWSATQIISRALIIVGLFIVGICILSVILIWLCFMIPSIGNLFSFLFS